MTHNINASKYHHGGPDSDYALWGTTTRKLTFRISSFQEDAKITDMGDIQVQVQLPPDLPNVKRATLIPQSFSLSPNYDPLSGANQDFGTFPPTVSNHVCLRCRELTQPHSFDNGALCPNWLHAPRTDHGANQGMSNIIMSMPVYSGDPPETVPPAADRSYQIYKEYNGNEYDCGILINNDCFTKNTLTFNITNELGMPFNFGATGGTTPISAGLGWYAVFSIVYEPEKTDFDLN